MTEPWIILAVIDRGSDFWSLYLATVELVRRRQNAPREQWPLATGPQLLNFKKNVQISRN